MYAALLIAWAATLLAIDYARVRTLSNRAFRLELLAFLVGGALIAFPDLTTRMANAVGVGRGVDFVFYPVLIWLAREALVSRQRRWVESRRFTELVRAVALLDRRTVPDRER